MKKHFSLLGIIVVCLYLLTCTLTSSAFAETFGRIVAFGDSLTDNGNIYELSSQAKPASSHSYEGRYSNGPVWVEYLSRYFSADLVDLAQGGAQTGDSESVPVGLKAQVSDYASLVSSYPSLMSDDTLYVVWAGPNDFLSGGTDYTGAAANILDALNMLADAGASYFVVPNMPNLGSIPLNNSIPDRSSAAGTLTQGFNSALQSGLDTFKQANPSVTVYDIDVYSLFSNIVSDPASYGFTDVTHKYVNDDGTVNDDGSQYLFWDDVHPTTAGHKLLARTVARRIGAASAAWFSSSGMLNIPRVIIGDYSDSYDVVLEHIGSLPSDSSGIYFKVSSLKSSNFKEEQ